MKIEKTNLKKKVNDRKIVLLAITGTLTALEAGKISVNEAECFLFSPFMAEVLKSCNCSRDIVEIIEEIIEEGCELEDIESLIPESLPEVIKNLRKKALDILGKTKGAAEDSWVSPVVDRKSRRKYKDADREKALRMLTYHEKSSVRAKAVEALCMGIQESSINRLYELLSCETNLIRGYAVSAWFDVWVNRNGYTEESMAGYQKNAEAFYQKEKDFWVKIFFEKNRYLSGDKAGLTELKRFLCENQGYGIPETIVKLLLDIRNLENEKEINRVLEEAESYISDGDYLKKEIEAGRKRKELPKILMIDRENAGVSQILEYLGNTGDFFLASAGIEPASEIKKEVSEQIWLEENGNLEDFQYPKGIRRVWKYDFIVPIGIRLKPEDCPFQRIIPLFEDVDENMLDAGRAKRMLKELRDSIYAEIQSQEQMEK